MGERTTYTPGTFCWTDLSTPDQELAKAFYGALFGWTSEDFPIGDGAVYSIMRIDGKDVAAMTPQPQQQRDAGMPPVWNSYVAVESADRAAARAGELGADVHAGPFDVFDSGRMAVIQDPQGAFFAVWEGREHAGAQLVNQHGALSWDELYTTDLDASSAFYGDLFGWQIQAMEGMSMPYRVIQNAGRGNGGMTTMEGMPPNWLVYFGTSDIEASAAKVVELGGEPMMGPMDIGVGQIAVVRDPHGAVFALYAGQFED